MKVNARELMELPTLEQLLPLGLELVEIWLCCGHDVQEHVPFGDVALVCQQCGQLCNDRLDRWEFGLPPARN